jgi:hypothetical protein
MIDAHGALCASFGNSLPLRVGSLYVPCRPVPQSACLRKLRPGIVIYLLPAACRRRFNEAMFNFSESLCRTPSN